MRDPCKDYEVREANQPLAVTWKQVGIAIPKRILNCSADASAARPTLAPPDNYPFQFSLLASSGLACIFS